MDEAYTFPKKATVIEGERDVRSIDQAVVYGEHKTESASDVVIVGRATPSERLGVIDGIRSVVATIHGDLDDDELAAVTVSDFGADRFVLKSWRLAAGKYVPARSFGRTISFVAQGPAVSARGRG
jgi:hypothetical protein